MGSKVTDPELLTKLGGSASGKGKKKVTDPALLEQLHGDTYAHPDDMGGYGQSYFAQGMSGVNEGLADMMSLPAQALTGVLSIGPAIANAFGGHVAYPDYVPDPGEGARNIMTQVGAIKPETTDGGKQFTRRIGRELGRSAIPIEAASLRAVQPLRTLGAEVLGALGSGTGAATANALAPGNPIAEIAGQVLGGGLSGLSRAGSRKVITPNPSSPERLLAADNMAAEGVGLTAGQRTGSRGLKYAESELGGAAAQNMMEDQAQQFTQAALRRAGINAERATPEVINDAYRGMGQEFDTLAANTTLRADAQLGKDSGDL